MTILESNQSYKEAMDILNKAKMSVLGEHDEVSYHLLRRVLDTVTKQQTLDFQRDYFVAAETI